MKSFLEWRKIVAIGAVVLLLLPGLCGCAVSAGGTDLPVPSEPTVVVPSNTGAAGSCAGTGNIGAKRLSGIKPVDRPIAAAPVKAQVINVLDIEGTVSVVSGGTEMPAYAGMRLSTGDKLTTGDNSRATLDLNNGGMVLVEPNSALEITQSTAEYVEVSLLHGNIINNIKKGSGKYAVKANNVTMGVLGTVFRVNLNGGTASVDLYEGRVSITLVGDGGEPRSFDLGEGTSFDGTDKTINNSIENGALETGELDLAELSDYALEWITQSLEERENDADDSGLLNELIKALHQEIKRRRRDYSPAAPPAPLPTTSPEPVLPNLVWGDASMNGMGTVGVDDYSLDLSWLVENSTTPWDFGIHWSYVNWNETETEENKDSFYTYNGTKYYISTYTGGETGNLTVTASNLSGPFETPDSTIDPVTVNIILIPREFDKDAAHVFDHNTVVVNDRTPTIAVDLSATDGMVDVTVTPPTDEITDYRTGYSDSISVSQPSYQISEADADKIAELSAYPEGVEYGVAVDSVDGDLITVDVYLPTEVIPVSTDPDPERPGEE